MLQDETLKQDTEEKASLTIVAFYEQTYSPWAESHLKPSSKHSLKQIWSQHLRENFAPFMLKTYKPHEASKFLAGMY